MGAQEEVVQKVLQIYSEKFGDEVIAGYRNGYFKDEDEQEIARQIADSGANILFLAMPSPRKENFIYNNSEILSGLNYNLGVGGAFDVVAGVTKRAPQSYRGTDWNGFIVLSRNLVACGKDIS